ncbi:BIG2 domain-containing protein [Pseudomonas sp. IT-P74]|uniref:RCC1 domain-containing protein n=1 Tax=Pseudomonas sp. IT-P74 TaxID=3026445 RepID=UPI0039E1C387
MLVQPVKNLNPLALLDPDIPGRTEPPLPSGEWGINRAAAQGNFPEQGLKVQLHVWSTQGLGDKVELLLNNNPVDQHTLGDPAEIGQRTTLWVAPARLPTGSYTLAYRVTRLNQAPETYAPPLELYVKLEIPGGQDTDPDFGHSNLFMFIPPDIVQGGVDKDIAELGVPIVIRAASGTGIPYPDAAEGDVIFVSWGGVLQQSAPLTAQQISDPVNHPIEVLITKDTIEQAGDTDSAGLAVTFIVRDKVGNYSEDWCKETRIVVSIGTSLLLAPIVKETLNNVLDLDALGDKPVTAQVWATPPSFELNDVIVVKMRGTTLDGDPVEITAPEKFIDNLPHTYEISLSSEDVRKLVKTQVIFSYEVRRAGSPDPLRSKGRFVQVVGEVDRLDAPIAEDEQQGSLDPDLPSTRIRIPFNPLIVVGTAIEPKWFGTRPNGSTYDPELEWFFPDEDEADDPKGFFITVDGKHLKTLEGGNLDLSYNLLTDEDGTVVRRGSEHAAKLKVGEPQLELVKPIVLGETDGALEPGDLPNGASRLTAPRPTENPSKSGDIVTYTWMGEVSGRTEDSITLNALTADKDVNFTLNATFVATHIEPNRGQKVTASYRILRKETGNTSYSNPLTFLVGTALELAPPKIRQAEPDGKTLLPMNAVEALTAEVPPAGLLQTDLLSVTWAAAPGSHAEGSHTTAARPISETSLNIELPVTVLAFNLGKTVTVTFTVTRDGKPVTSLPLSLAVQNLPQSELPKPLILAADNDGEGPEFNVGNLTANTASRIGVWPLISAGQRAWMILSGTYADNSHYYYSIVPGSAVSQQWIDNGFQNRGLTAASLRTLKDGSTLTIECKATLNKSTNESEAVVFPVRTYTIKAFKLPVATFWEATGAGNDLLNPDDVYPLGATVVIAQTALLKTDDFITVEVQGKTVTTYTHQVQPEEADKELKTIKVAYSVIADNVDSSISLSYSIARKAGGTDGPADPSVYDVRRVIGSGNLKVMGARNIRSTRRASRSSQVLSAFNTTTDQPVQAQWKYPGDSDWTTAATWRDSKPQEPLQVRTSDDQLTLNPANIIGNGSSIGGQSAFVALRDAGDVVAWGRDTHGATIPAPIITLDDIVEVSGNGGAFAARRADGEVVAWGSAEDGGDMTGSPLDFVEVVGNGRAFAGLKTTGHVVAWGNAGSGGAVPAPIAALNDVVRVVTAHDAFVAQRTTGHVLAWGRADHGGTLPEDIARLTDIKTIIGNVGAFAALRANGSLVAWGYESGGGKLPDNIAAMTDIIELCCATNHSFTARRATGKLICWGLTPWIGQIGELIDIVDVSAAMEAFAARRGNGRVVAWGNPSFGGTVPGDIADLDDIVQVCGTFTAFAALRKNGTVVAWGERAAGGDTSTVVDQLTNVLALYSNICGFTALTSDGRVVTWGIPEDGGDSSAVQDRLRGHVSYRANAASRGRALKASCRAALNANPHLQDR